MSENIKVCFMNLIYHLAHKDDWDRFASTPEYSCSSLSEEGFIHCSEDREQALKVANRLFKGLNSLIVLELDVMKLKAPLKREASRSGEIYPHIYGPINTDAVAQVLALHCDNNGQFSSIV